VISERPPSADERFLFIKAIFTSATFGCKAPFRRVLQLAAVQTLVLPSPTSAQGWAVPAIPIAMQQVARETWVAFERRKANENVVCASPAARLSPQVVQCQCFTQSTLGTRRAFAVPPPSLHGADRHTQSQFANVVSHLISGLCATHVRPPPECPQSAPRALPEQCRGQAVSAPEGGACCSLGRVAGSLPCGVRARLGDG
jgi:hypothetical protein